MDKQKIDQINQHWKQFLKIYWLFPLALIGLIVLIGFQVWAIITSVLADPSHLSSANDMQMMGTMMTNSIGMILSIVLFICLNIGFTLWFIFKCDTLFTLLGTNRWVGNSLNVLGIYMLGLSFLVTPFYLSNTLKSFYADNGVRFDWFGFIKEN